MESQEMVPLVSGQKKKSRCPCCRKVSFLLVECSMCHDYFCLADRLPESHHCLGIDGYKETAVHLVQLLPSKVDHL